MKFFLLILIFYFFTSLTIIAQEINKNWQDISNYVVKLDDEYSNNEIKRIQMDLAKMKSKGPPVYQRQFKINYFESKIKLNKYIISSKSKDLNNKNSEIIIHDHLSRLYKIISFLNPKKDKTKITSLYNQTKVLKDLLSKLQKV